VKTPSTHLARWPIFEVAPENQEGNDSQMQIIIIAVLTVALVALLVLRQRQASN
jgi:hypothetical protein